VTVERLDEMSGERLRALLDAGIEPGRSLRAVSVNPASGMVGFASAAKPTAISLVLAGSVLVRAS
jgi:FeoA domain